MRIYLVGGAVRDALLLRPVTDRDFVVLEADETALLERLPRLKRVGGGPQGVYILGSDQYTLSPAPDILADLALRDLTVNALAREQLPGGRWGPLQAHPLALADLGARLLRPVAVENFGHDPCRAVRAARFAAQLAGFGLTPALFQALEHAREHGLERVAPERIAQELRKACAGPAPGRFLAVLAKGRCLEAWFPPFAQDRELRLVAQGLMQRLAGSPGLWVYMGLCHHLPSDLALELGQRLRLSGEWCRSGEAAAALPERLRDYALLPAGERVDLLLTLHRHRLGAPLCRLARLHWPETPLDLEQRLLRDTLRLLGVRLPRALRNWGPASGAALLALRVKALEQEAE